MSADPPCPACESTRTYTVRCPSDHHYRCAACQVRWPIPGEWNSVELAKEFRRLAGETQGVAAATWQRAAEIVEEKMPWL